jgi:translation elongation factor EF-Tu-like GTPase
MKNEQQGNAWRYPRDIEAQITFLTSDYGGRKTPARTGYRPQFSYDGQDWDAIQTYPEREAVYPGETVIAYLTFLSPDHHKGKLYAGKEFQVREGTRVVATGVVTKILQLDSRTGRLVLEPPSGNASR